jgi:hypothetical protein
MNIRNPNKPEVFDLLSPQQINSLPMLAAGESAKFVAEKIGVTPQTISLWLNHDPDFRLGLWLFKNDALDAALSQLQTLAIEAVFVVRKLLLEGSTEQIRLKAAQLVIDRLDTDGRPREHSRQAIMATVDSYGLSVDEKVL